MLGQQIARSIDNCWIAIGLDLHHYSQAHPKHARRIAVALIAIGVTIGYAFLQYVFAALLVSWEQSFSWKKSELTIGYTASIFISALVAPYAGKAIDAGLGRWVLSAGMLLGGIAVAILSLVSSQVAFIAVWLVIGVAQGCCLYEPCFAFITRILHDDASKAITNITLTAGFASTITFPTAAAIDANWGWEVVVLVFAAVIVFIGAPAMYAAGTLLECYPNKERQHKQKAEDKAAFKAIRSRLEYWVLFAALPLLSLTTSMTLTHIIPILLEKGITPAHAVLFVAMIGPMQVAGRFFVRFVVAKIGTLATTFLSFFGITVATTLLFFAGAQNGLIALYACLFGIFYGLISLLKPILTAETLGRNAFGLVSGSLAVPFLIAYALAPQIGSELWAVTHNYALPLAMGILTAMLGLGCIVLLIFLKKRQALIEK